MSQVTIGITTRNRPRAIARCVRSLACLGSLASRVIVFDDASDEPVARLVAESAPPGMSVTVIRDEQQIGGYIEGRNRIVRQADTPFVLLLDDDAVVFSADAVLRAVAVLERDENVAAIAFAQAEDDGRPWNGQMQPGPWDRPSYVPSFIGFAHLLRRSVFLALGGYRTSFVFYGEEKDFCLRLLEAGHHVVYLPDARVAHLPDPSGRDQRRYVRYVIRNDCLMALYNIPWPLVVVAVPRTLWRYRRMAPGIPDGDRGGMHWLLTELWRALPAVLAERRSVSWGTVRRWRRLRAVVHPYECPRAVV